MPTKLIPIDIQEALRLYKTGLNLTEIGKVLGVSREIVRRRLIGVGVQIRTRWEANTKQVDIQKASQMYIDGMSSKNIAKIMNVSDTTIRERLYNIGIQIRTHHECSSTVSENERRSSSIQIGDKNVMYGKIPAHGKGIYYDSTRNGVIWMRSSYELRFCQVADDLCYSYDWETKAFPLEIGGKKTTYRPDVFIRDLNLWIEIKGYWRGMSQFKFEAFKEKYKDEQIVVMYKEELARFENGDSLVEIYSI